MIIDCAECALAPSLGGPAGSDPHSACSDCVVSVLLGPPVVEVSQEQADAMAHLADAGLVPPLRLVASGEGLAPPAGTAPPRLRRVV